MSSSSASSNTAPPAGAAGLQGLCSTYREEFVNEDTGELWARSAKCPDCPFTVAFHARRPPPVAPVQAPASPVPQGDAHQQDEEEEEQQNGVNHNALANGDAQAEERSKWTSQLAKQATLLPKWKPGHSVPHAFLNTCEQVLAVTGIPQQYWSTVLLFSQPLEAAAARSWIASHILGKALSWAQARSAFTKHFQTSDYQLHLLQEYRRCRLQKSESVQDYADRFQELCTQLNYDDDNQAVIQQFIANLTVDTRRDFIRHWGLRAMIRQEPSNQFTSLAEVITTAIEVDVAARSINLDGGHHGGENKPKPAANGAGGSGNGGNGKKSCKHHPNSTSHTTAECQLGAGKKPAAGNNNNNSRPKGSGNNTQPKGDNSCYACGEKGHYSYDPNCPAKKGANTNGVSGGSSSAAGGRPNPAHTQKGSSSSGSGSTGGSNPFQNRSLRSANTRQHGDGDDGNGEYNGASEDGTFEGDLEHMRFHNVCVSSAVTLPDRTLAPAIMASSKPKVLVRVGKAWYPALIDSGATTSHMDVALARQLGIAIDPRPGVVDLATNTTTPRLGCAAAPVPVEVMVLGSAKDLPLRSFAYQFEVQPLHPDMKFILGSDLMDTLFPDKVIPSELGAPAMPNGPILARDAPAAPPVCMKVAAASVIDALRELHPEGPDDAAVLGVIPDGELPLRTAVSTSDDVKAEYDRRRAEILRDPAFVDALAANQALSGFCNLPEATVYLQVKPGTEDKLYRKQYKIAEALHPFVDEIVTRWAAEGKIKPAPRGCRYNNALTCAAKKDEFGNFAGVRVCLDVRPLNAALVTDDRFQLPGIRDNLEVLGGNTIFGEWDLVECYLQFLLSEDSQELTAFTWGGQQWVFVGTPFGLYFLTSHCQRLMKGICRDLPFAPPYLDNLPFGSKSWSEHRDHAITILHRLTQCNLKVKVKAGEEPKLGHSQIRCLGHLLSAKGIGIHPEKLASIRDWPPPVDGLALQSFLGFVTYVRQHVRHFAELTAPLEAIKNVKGNIVWTEELVSHFELTKRAICAAPLLQFSNPAKPYCVATDASNTGVGGVLYQPDEVGGEMTATNIVAICSKKLSASQRNYSAYKKELWGIVYALRQFHSYIWGRTDTVLFTDHKPLTYMLSSPVLSPALQQWLDTVLDYQFQIRHRPGVMNIIPDILSRMYAVETATATDNPWGLVVEHPLPTEDSNIQLAAITAATVTPSLVSPGEGSSAEAASDSEEAIGAATFTPLSPAELAVEMEKRGKTAPLSASERQLLVTREHLFGHFGRDAVFKALFNKGFWWPHMRADIAAECNDCDACTRYNVAKAGFNPAMAITSTAPGDHLQIDCSVHLPPSPDGYTALLFIIDVYTGFLIVRPLKATSAHEVARNLWEVFCIIGIPKILQSDNGPEFVNDILRAMVKLTGMDHRLISPYNPRADGKVERSIGTTMSIIKKMLHGSNHHWPLFVPFAQLSFNNKVASLTGASPFSLMFGRKLNELTDYTKSDPVQINYEDWKQHQEKLLSVIYPAIEDRVKIGKDKMVENLNKHRRLLLADGIPAGAVVMLRDVTRANKFEPKYVGPYTVVRRTHRGNYMLRDATGDILDRHVPPDQLKLVAKKPRAKDKTAEVYEVESIVDHRGEPGKREYLVKWKGYDASDNSWEPEASFLDNGITQRYWKAYYSANPAAHPAAPAAGPSPRS